jgi:hypothetical protein
LGGLARRIADALAFLFTQGFLYPLDFCFTHKLPQRFQAGDAFHFSPAVFNSNYSFNAVNFKGIRAI